MNMAANQFGTGFTIISFPTKINLWADDQKIWPSGKPTSQRITDFRSEIFRSNYTHWSQFSKMLNEVFLDHIDKKGMITSFSNTIDFIKHEAQGCEDDDTKVHGIICSQAFHRVYQIFNFRGKTVRYSQLTGALHGWCFLLQLKLWQGTWKPMP